MASLNTPEWRKHFAALRDTANGAGYCASAMIEGATPNVRIYAEIGLTEALQACAVSLERCKALLAAAKGMRPEMVEVPAFGQGER